MSEGQARAGTPGIDALLRNNDTYATVAHRNNPDGHGTPRTGVAVVACMDARLDVFQALGLRPGDAHVIRNAGGVVTDDVIRSLVISRRLLGTREIMLIHHSDCGMLKFRDDDLKQRLQAETGHTPPFAFEAFEDLDADLRQSAGRIRSNPFLQPADAVRGFVYEVDTGRLREVR